MTTAARSGMVILRSGLALGTALLCLQAPAAHAQLMPYDKPDSAGSDAPSDGGDRPAPRRGSGVRTKIQPYIEVTQNLLAELRPGDEVVTYTAVAAGADVQLNGRRTQGALSVRYERRFVEKGNYRDGDTISGLARVGHDLIPRTLRIEAGAMAARSRVDGGGGASLSGTRFSDSVSQVYSLYAGPSLSTHVGDVAVNGGYTIGYTKVENPKAVQLVPGGPRTDLFDHSLSQSAQLSAGVKPGDVLPVGIVASGSYAQEDISNLDQRFRELRAGVQVTVPVSLDVALVGDVGWNDVEVSSRDALRDSAGRPVLGSDGRYKTDKSQPRRMAYDSSGLTWDVGVIWRPSRRTSLSAFVGRRYDSTTYYGSFSYNPNARHSLSVSVFDGISGFGSSLNNSIQALPTDFETVRDPFGGDISGCGFGESGGGCVNGAFGSLSSSVFRGRGINATYGLSLRRLRATLGAGYTHRKFFGAPGTVLAGVNGRVSENFYVSGGLGGPIDAQSGFGVNVYEAWFHNRANRLGDTSAWGGSASYYRKLTDRLVATAAVGLDSVNYKVVDDQLILTGQLGLRYNF
ncbi:preprotein translocase subunit YajC [Novosphingobium sp. KCTC 2891]|uniref:preprotein translocase subunit YajC n=1 Tax=Novosphingobium sp. KCTC 2891 TaxID=2989730 RepID=UPI0022222E66|nr:preprotein translocase subunit YajC [Novosphingobium sp. KCTC 2891]MCW1381702.1 preprotein translocase subunit YajC [Novosphingobium sp. KCTC 2891]